jgi:hypothetical protein
MQTTTLAGSIKYSHTCRTGARTSNFSSILNGISNLWERFS